MQHKMKVILSLAAALLTTAGLLAQAPVNDAFNCATMIDFGVAPHCTSTIYTNENATPSIIATVDTVSCFNSAVAQRDVWFKFTCSDTLYDYRITIKAAGIDPIVNPEIAIYRGDCVLNGLGEIGCASAQVGEDSLFIDLFNLTPNEIYYIRVSDWSATAAPNSGGFTLCVEEIPPILTIGDGGSSLCSGTLYDSGGATGDYGINENYTFVICPDQPSECISFSLEYYNLEPSLPGQAGAGDELNFFDGPTANSPLLASLDGNGFQPEYIAGGGGVCFQVQATSGCLTVQFKSDNSVQESGWKGTWSCSSDPCIPKEKIQIDTAANFTDIQNAVSTGGAVVTVTGVNCPQGGMGTFAYPSDNNDLELEKGLLLTSGSALGAIGPNNFGGESTQNDPLFTADPGDADLQYLSDEFGGGSTTYDVCSVELDVFAATNEVVFEYVFGSEEYPEFVWAFGGYNDIFAFLVSGPGIAGDPNLTNSALNIATLPTTGTLVQIDSVNNQVNWEYYRNNEIGEELQYDGLTSDLYGVKKSLTARVPVTPCNTYHLKLAIADRGDESYDSGVFVSDIRAGSPDLDIAFSSGLDYFIETCTGTNDTLFITLNKLPTVATSFNVTLGGTATQDEDYELNIPPSITFQPGQQTLAFPIIPLTDNLTEGTEYVTVTLSRDYGCGEVNLKSIKVDILDNVEVQVQGGDTLSVCIGDFLQLNATGATNYVWSPQDAVSNPFVADPFTSPFQSLWLVLTGSVGACVDVDSVFVRVIAPTVTAETVSPDTICLGGSVQLQATSSESTVVWSPATGLDDENSFNPVATPTFPTTYTASATLEGCVVSASVTVIVDSLFFPELIDDLVQCQNYPVQLANTLNSTTQYEWLPETGLSDPTVSGPVALPDITTQYILTATSPNGVCSQSDTVTITVTPADVEISGPDSIFLCLGQTPVLNAVAAPPGATVVWDNTSILSSSAGPSVIASPTETVTVTATYNINGCIVRDSVYLKVDSLPNLDIFLMPEKPFYCPGDTIFLLSNTYEPANFPGIKHSWEPFGTMLTPFEKWNMVVIATDTFLYNRTTTVGACQEKSTELVIVPQPPILTATVNPNPICPGGNAQIIITSIPANTVLEWEENSAVTLSCDDCPNPVASPLNSTSYRVTTPEAECPSGLDVLVNVTPLPPLNLPANPESCNGSPVSLNDSDFPGVIYQWTPPTFLNNPNIGNPVSTPTQPGAITYTVEATRNGCTTAGVVTVNSYVASVDITTPAQTICEGKEITLAATTTGTPGTLNWLPAGPTVTPASAQTYTATLFFGGNCIVQDSVKIDVAPYPQLLPASNPVSCNGSPVILNNTDDAGVTYTWTPPTYLNNPNVGNPTATPTQSGEITYKVEASRSGCIATAEVKLNSYFATLDVTTPDQLVCEGTQINLATAVTGTPGTLNWLPAGPAVTPTAPQTYTATLFFGGICSIQDSVRLDVQPLPVLQLTNNPTVCLGSSVSLNGTNESGVSYVWTPASFLNNPAAGNPVATPTQNTTYSVVATTALGNCKAQGTVNVTVADATVSLGPDQTICFGSPVTLTAAVTGTQGGSFEWEANPATTPTITVSPIFDQSYTVTYKYGPAGFCTSQDVVNIAVGSPLELSDITAPEDSVCAGAPVVLKVEITLGDGDISWLADGVVIPNATLDSVTVTPQGTAVNYEAVLTDATGCTASAGPVTVLVRKCFDIPNAFTPNGDSSNDTFGPVLYGATADILEFNVYSRWGQKVFTATDGKKEWDGRVDGKDAPSDVYVYQMKVRFLNGEEEDRTGQVTLVR